MKKIRITLAAVAILAGILVAGCRRGDDSQSPSGKPGSFETFSAELLDNNFWSGIRNPGVMGPGDEAVLAIGRGGYESPEVYSGDVTWRLSEAGVLVFFDALRSGVSDDQLTATGSIVGIKAVGEGDVTVTATDATGAVISHDFRVGEGQHYSPDAEWRDDSSHSGGYYSGGYYSGGYYSGGYYSGGYYSGGYYSGGYYSGGYYSGGYYSGGYYSGGYYSGGYYSGGYYSGGYSGHSTGLFGLLRKTR